MPEKKEVEANDYNPFEHRHVEKPNSDLRAAANIIKSSLGSGLLAGPLAFSNTGWGVGIVGTLLMGFICGHCIHIFVKTSRGCCKLEKKPSMGYAETSKSAFLNGPKNVRPFANAASILSEFALGCTYIGVCCIYTVLISDSVKQLVDRYVPSVVWPVEYYSLIFLIPLCLLCQIRYLKFLAIFAIIANILLVTTYLICLYYIFKDGIDFSDKKIAGDPARYPAFASTVIFAMEGVGVVMPVENVMKNPTHFLGFPSVLFVAMSIIVFLYATLGLFGYVRYGDVLKGSITLNLPINEWPAICAKMSIASCIFFTYPLQFFVVMDIFTRYTDHRINGRYKKTIQTAVRIVGVCFCVGVGVALPLLEQIINLVGSVFYSILGLVIPAVVETVFRWNNLGRFNWVLWKNTFIVLFGFGILVSGCTVTITDIILKLHRKVEYDVRSLANLVKASLGSGLLAIPLAFSNSGWGLGIIGTAVIAFICTHSAHIFVEISQACCRVEKKPILSYSETCESAFSNGPKAARRIASAARIFAEFALLFTYLGVACIFTVLIAASIKQILDTYMPAYIMPVEYYCLILLVPLCLLVQIRHLKFLAPLSLVANILLIFTFFICLYYILKDGFSVSDKKVVGDPARFPAFLSTVIFAMEGIGVVMPIANQMKNPQRFLGCPGVLSIAMTLVAVLYGTLGMLGYFKYGDMLRGTITLNLPIDEWPAICAKCFIAISIFLTYPLHYFVVIDLLTKYLQPKVKENYRTIFQVVLRAAIVCFCAAIAVALPFLEQIINIVGSLFYSTLGLIIPAIIHSVFHFQNLGKWNWVLWKNSLIVIFGTVALVSGCAVTVSDIIDKLNSKTE